jgi:hypothetical protein
MQLNFYQKVCLGFLIVLVIFWMGIFYSGTTNAFSNYLYSFLFGLIPLIGGFVAMFNSRLWGRSAVGKAVFFIGLGLFLWGCGETIWSYYNFFLHIPAPYPSLADLGFAPSIFFYGLGTFYLSEATGARFGLRSMTAKIMTVIVSLVVFAVSYYVLVVVARGGVLIPEGETTLKLILDIVYPVGDFIAFLLAVVISGLSFRYLGGRYAFDAVSIFLGLFVMFVADSVFSYTTTVGTYYNGNFGDMLLTLGLFFLTFGVLGFVSKVKE